MLVSKRLTEEEIKSNAVSRLSSFDFFLIYSFKSSSVKLSLDITFSNIYKFDFKNNFFRAVICGFYDTPIAERVGLSGVNAARECQSRKGLIFLARLDSRFSRSRIHPKSSSPSDIIITDLL
jgi:hypothetical protein